MAVGREGVACRGRRERKKGDFDPLLANGILTEGVLALSPSRFLPRSYVRLTMRDATTSDVCAPSPAAAKRNTRNTCVYMCVRIHAACTHILHDATLLCMYSLLLSGRPGSTVQRQRVEGVMREVQQRLGENASSEGAVE